MRTYMSSRIPLLEQLAQYCHVAPDETWLHNLGEVGKLVETHVTPSPQRLEGVGDEESEGRP